MATKSKPWMTHEEHVQFKKAMEDSDMSISKIINRMVEKLKPKVNPDNPNDTKKEFRKPTDADATDYFELKITPKKRNK